MKHVLVVALVLVGGCSAAEEQAPAPRQKNAGVSETALATTYEFEEYPGSAWYGPDSDRMLPTDVINAQTGPDHCGWEPVVLLNLGWPLGEERETASETRQYLRDPEGVMESEWMLESYEAEVELPKGAEYTGYRTEFMELWLDPKDADAAYLAFLNHVERWPRARNPLACD